MEGVLSEGSECQPPHHCWVKYLNIIKPKEDKHSKYQNEKLSFSFSHTSASKFSRKDQNQHHFECGVLSSIWCKTFQTPRRTRMKGFLKYEIFVPMRNRFFLTAGSQHFLWCKISSNASNHPVLVNCHDEILLTALKCHKQRRQSASCYFSHTLY